MAEAEAEPADRNDASFHRRFRAMASISVGEHGILLEQTDGEQAEEEVLQSTVWSAAVVMAEWMVQVPELWKDRTVVELGSGCGLLGILAAKLGAHSVHLSDLPPLLPLLRRNAAANGVRATVCALDWEHPEDDALQLFPTSPDVIIGSDITCFVQALPHLAIALERLAASSTTILLAHHVRGNDTASLLETFGQRFSCERVALSSVAKVAKADSVHLYRFRRSQRESGAVGLSVGGHHYVRSEESEGDVTELELEAALRGNITALKRRFKHTQ